MTLRRLECIRIATDSSNDVIRCEHPLGYRLADVVGSSIAIVDGPNADRRVLRTQSPRMKINESGKFEKLLIAQKASGCAT